LPFSVNAANTITLERASVIATAADSVTVQAIFSAPIYLQKGRMDLGRQVFTLRNSHAGGGCASSYANQWTWETKSNLVDYVNPIMKGTTPYSSVINLTFPRSLVVPARIMLPYGVRRVTPCPIPLSFASMICGAHRVTV
jgi:hypothetical protein